ncbi:MAG: ABC transporter ATP-binding protein [Bacteroidales bacterium]|nr:ABC transporter ATP-binding protein [Bacteroidales bacterium]
MNGKANILKIESLTIGYNAGSRNEKILLSSLKLSVRKGEMLALLGPNGIGKSTLLYTLAGLHPAVRGEIFLSGKKINLYSSPELARKISFVFTGGYNVYNMSVFETVSLGRFPHTNWLGQLTANDRAVVEQAIDSVGLSAYSGNNIGELSDGERQRAMIARALAQDTELIILDEPTAFLDLPNRYELISLLRKLSADNNKSVVFSSHDIHIAIREADKVWLASPDGITEGAPEDLALKGSFDKLFADSELSFVPEEGVFTYPVRTRMTIKLLGEKLVSYWTERALNRLGIRAEPGAVSPSVTITRDAGEYLWIYESSVVTKEFRDVYGLILYMKEILQG